MRNHKTHLMAVCAGLFAMVFLSGCHAFPQGGQTTTFVSKSDSTKTLKIAFPETSAMARVHMAILNAKLKGTYTLDEGGAVSEGTLKRDGAVYLLESNGTVRRFEMEKSGGLKDESGEVWNLVAPATTTAQKLKGW